MVLTYAEFIDALSRLPESDRYTHDCDICVYLGSARPESLAQIDFYRCPQPALKIPTIVARHGGDGPDYMSGGDGFTISGIEVPAIPEEVSSGDS